MLYLYDKNTIDFTNNGEPIRHSYDEHVIREEGFYLTFKLLLDKNSEYKKIKKEMIVSAETPDGRNQFRVYDVVKRQNHIEVLAVQLMYDFDNKMINPFKVTNVSGTTVINRFVSAFKASLGPFTLSSSVSETHDFATNDVDDDTPSHNALEVLNRITNRWDSELLLNGYDIRMVKRLGTKTNALLYEKKNISEFEDESSVRDMATRIYATSQFTTEGDDEETVISVTVDSPLINEYAQIYEKSFVNNDARTKQELINWVNLKYSTENTDKPTRNIKVSTNIIDGTEINYGDELVLKYLIHDVDEVIRCVGYDYNPVAHTYYSITLGDWKDSFATTLTGGVVDATQRQVNQIKKNVTHILMNADGYHRNAYGPEPVPNPINGDVWYYFEWDRPNEIEMRIFEDGFWVPVPFGTKGQIDEAIAEAESAKQAAEQSYADSVAEAERLVQAQTEIFDSQMTDVNQEINTVKSNIDTSIANVNQEIVNNFTSLSDSLSTVSDISNQAKSDAQTALSNAATALGNAQTAISQLGGLSGKITSVENDIDDINGVLLQKVSTADFNSLTGRVSTAEGQISTQAGQIALRVTETQAKSIAGSAVGALEIGGRNLILNSAQIIENDTYNIAIYVLAETIQNGETVTLTLKGALATTKSYFNVYNSGGSVPLAALDSKGNGIYQKTFNWTVGASSNNKLYIYTFIKTQTGTSKIERIKLERGTKATDWSPASEDAIQLISAVSSELSIEKDKITALLTRTDNNETVINQVKSTADGTAQTVADHAGRLTTVETNVSGLQVSVADKVSNAQFTVLSTSVSSVVSDLNNLEIGGRNRFTKTTTVSPKTAMGGFILRGADTPNGFRVTGVQAGTSSLRLPNVIDSNGWWTVSFSMRGNQNVTVSVTVDICDRGGKRITTYNTSNLYERHSVSVNVTNYTSDVFNFVDFDNFDWRVYFIDDIKIEKGNKATDWTPAPEDVQSQITQLSTDINLRVTKGDVVSQINIEAGRTLISSSKLLLDANTYIMGTTFANDVKAKSLEAITANITSIRSQVLVTDSVTSTHIKADTALINSIFATTALITALTSKTAFINNIKAIEINASKITSGTLNSTIVNAIAINTGQVVGLNSSFIQSQWNLLDATTSITGTGLVSQQGALSTRLTGGEIATVSGTKTGKINALGMEIYDSSNGQTTRLHSDGLEFNWYGIKRVFEQNSEGMTIRPITGSGARLNSSLHITTGAGADKVAYIDFNNPTSGYGGRIILQGLDMGVRHPAGGVVQIASYANDGRAGNLRAGTFQTSTYDGRGLRIVESQINTLADNQTLYIMPSGTGELRIGSGGSNPVLWPVRASRFVEGSSRASKTNINPYVGSALDEIKNLQAVTFNRKEDVTNGINYMSLGFIAEDSPFIAIQQPGAPLGVDHYKMVTLAIKGVQELVSITDKHTSDILRIDTFVGQHEQEINNLKQEIASLKQEVEYLKSA